MDDDLAALHRVAGVVVVEDVTFDEAEVWMVIEVRELQRIAVQVVVNHHFVVVEKACHEVGANETSAAGNQDSFHKR